MSEPNKEVHLIQITLTSEQMSLLGAVWSFGVLASTGHHEAARDIMEITNLMVRTNPSVMTSLENKMREAVTVNVLQRHPELEPLVKALKGGTA